eukprot:101120_1
MWNRVKTVVLNMGQPLSVLTALVVFSATIQAGCIHDDDPAYVVPPDEKIDCSQDSTGQELGEAACKATTGCKWEESHTVKATPSKSKTIVEFKDGRILKSLPPIEAILEYIGDSVYYAQLRTHIPKIYNGEIDVLKPITEDSLSIIQAPGRYQKTQPIDAMHHIALLQYSRPLLDTTPFPEASMISVPRFGYYPNSGVRKMGMIFTLSNVVSIAHMAWWDALIMNIDRFWMWDGQPQPNLNNMMLYRYSFEVEVEVEVDVPPTGMLAFAKKTKKKKEKKKEKQRRYVYVPIDQGFAGTVVLPWFHYDKQPDPDPDAGLHAEEDPPERGVWFTKEGALHIKERDPEVDDNGYFNKKWNKRFIKWYARWVASFGRRRAETFVNNNWQYFPDLVKKGRLDKIIDIIHATWEAKGVKLCADMGDEIEKRFDEIDGAMDEGFPWSLLKDSKMLAPTKLEWAKVKENIKKQIETCKNSETTAMERAVKKYKDEKPERVQKWYEEQKTWARERWIDIESQLTTDPDIDRFKFKTSAATAKQVRYDVLDLEIDSKDVSEDSDERYDDAYSGVDYADSHPLQSDKYDWNDFVVGGLFGGTAIAVIVLVFCIGLACGLISCLGYKQHADLEGNRDVYWKESGEEEV